MPMMSFAQDSIWDRQPVIPRQSALTQRITTARCASYPVRQKQTFMEEQRSGPQYGSTESSSCIGRERERSPTQSAAAHLLVTNEYKPRVKWDDLHRLWKQPITKRDTVNLFAAIQRFVHFALSNYKSSMISISNKESVILRWPSYMVCNI